MFFCRISKPSSINTIFGCCQTNIAIRNHKTHHMYVTSHSLYESWNKMYLQIFLILSLFLRSGLPFPFYESSINSSEDKSTKAPSNLPLNENQQKSTDTTKESEISDAETIKETTETEQSNDLTVQETFYPAGGVWWGIRPWGGWGGWGSYRPWHGWHGWGGPQWGGSWGGHWGGGRWGRAPS